MQTYAQGMGAELLHVRNNYVTEVEIIHENPRGLLSGDYGVPVNLIENPRCESRIRVSSHAWPKLSSLDDWQSGRKRYVLVQVYRIPPYTWRNIDFPFIAPPGETREIAPTAVRCATFTPSFPLIKRIRLTHIFSSLLLFEEFIKCKCKCKSFENNKYWILLDLSKVSFSNEDIIN